MNDKLTPKTVELLKLSDEKRIESILSFKWLPYSFAMDTLGIMKDLRDYPKSDRMPNLLLVGDTNNGKTAILKRFAQQDGNKPFAKEDTGTLTYPVLYVQAPPEPDERRFYDIILESVYAPYKVNDRVGNKQKQVINTLKNLQVKILIIDEIQHILAGNQQKQRQFLNVIKYLSNELMIPFIGAGVMTALNAIQNEEQLSNRFERRILPTWKVGAEYNRLLESFEQTIPLKNISNLTEDSMALKLLSMSEGTIGEISKILKKASVLAIKNKSERITLQLLNKIDYVSPSNRMKHR
jgi:DNA polymerase III delta prime subunit